MRTIRRMVGAGLLCGVMLLGLGRGAVAAGAAPTSAGPVNINSASAEELIRLPGVGPALAKAIVEFRAAEPFHKTEDLRKVKGIGDKLYERLKDQITVGDTPAAQKGRGG